MPLARRWACAVGVQFFFRQHARFQQGGVQRDCVMAMGQQEAVAAFPFRLIGANGHCVAPGHGQHIGPAQGLAHIALSLHFAHAQRKAAHAIGMGL